MRLTLEDQEEGLQKWLHLAGHQALQGNDEALRNITGQRSHKGGDISVVSL